MEAAERIHKESIVIDATCPLLTEDATHLHLCRAGGVTAVAPTIRANTGTSADAILKFGYWLRLAREDDQVVIVRKAADIQVAKKAGKIGVILHFQGTEVLDKSVDIIDAYHALVLRVVQITYNKRCHVGDGIEEPSDAGLSRYGKSVVRRLNDTKIIVDCSHTGLRTSLEAVEYSNAPVVLSHANPRAVRDVPRNVPDDLYRAIAASGGVIGVAGFPNFVAASPRPTLDQFIDHIVHIADLVGIDRDPAEKSGASFNMAVLVAWLVPVLIGLSMTSVSPVNPWGFEVPPWYLPLPCTIACGILYILLSKFAGGRAAAAA